MLSGSLYGTSTRNGLSSVEYFSSGMSKGSRSPDSAYSGWSFKDNSTPSSYARQKSCVRSFSSFPHAEWDKFALVTSSHWGLLSASKAVYDLTWGIALVLKQFFVWIIYLLHKYFFLVSLHKKFRNLFLSLTSFWNRFDCGSVASRSGCINNNTSSICHFSIDARKSVDRAALNLLRCYTVMIHRLPSLPKSILRFPRTGISISKRYLNNYLWYFVWKTIDLPHIIEFFPVRLVKNSSHNHACGCAPSDPMELN